ncbi:MAG: PP2C family protein-serine/threonine phosphatase [Longimicrobiales bacterium]
MDKPLTERSAFLTDRGRRRVNQDAVLVETLPGGAELVAVADGMGGQSGGEIASSRALQVLRDALVSGQDLERAVRMANEAIYQQASADPDLQGMGTTLVGVLRRKRLYSVVNVGDSRAYRVDAAGIWQLTEDHSFLAEAIRSGRVSTDEAEKSPWRNAVTRAVGTEPELEVDYFGPFDAHEPHIIVLCTDGVYRTLSDDELRRLILAASGPEDAARAVAEAAYNAGSTDNISVALVQYGAEPSL